MKTAIQFLLAAFLVLLGSAKSDFSSELKTDENLLSAGSEDRTISHRFSGGYWSPLICDNVVTDELSGTLDVHCVMHLEDGAIVWMIMRYTGSLTSQKTGETFEIKEVDMSDLPKPGLITFHSNIRGDKGSHIIISATLDASTWEMTINQSVCN